MTTQTYQDAAQHLLQQAETELAAGDARQAAEKAWGAAAQAVKAVCESRGWRHRNYKSLRRAVTRLQEETGNSQIDLLYRSAYLMHVNFYEDSEDEQWVRNGLTHARELVEMLQSLSLPATEERQ